jgi:hypothetical protein
LPPEQLHRKVVVLDEGQVLEQATQGHRGGWERLSETSRVQSSALPYEVEALPLQSAQEGIGLVAPAMDGSR